MAYFGQCVSSKLDPFVRKYCITNHVLVNGQGKVKREYVTRPISFSTASGQTRFAHVFISCSSFQAEV